MGSWLESHLWDGRQKWLPQIECLFVYTFPPVANSTPLQERHTSTVLTGTSVFSSWNFPFLEKLSNDNVQCWKAGPVCVASTCLCPSTETWELKFTKVTPRKGRDWGGKDGKERNESCLSQVNLEEESTHASWEGRGKLRALGRCQHHSPGLSLSTKVLFVGLLSCPITTWGQTAVAVNLTLLNHFWCTVTYSGSYLTVFLVLFTSLGWGHRLGCGSTGNHLPSMVEPCGLPPAQCELHRSREPMSVFSEMHSTRKWYWLLSTGDRMKWWRQSQNLKK